VGYKNLSDFRAMLAPYFLVRRTREVESELPKIISKKILLDMDPEQKRVYGLALSGAIYKKKLRQKYFEMCDIMKLKEAPTEKEILNFEKLKIRFEESLTSTDMATTKLAALSYCQLASNGPYWVGEEGPSAKEEEFKRLLDQEIRYEKVIVFTRFETGIARLGAILDELAIKYVRVTGAESKDDRKSARLSFQDMNSGVQVIFITLAGSAAINLQTANYLIFYDSPWSFGDLYQTIGRAQRIGSVHSHIIVYHFVCKKTIDEHVLDLLAEKKKLNDEVVGDIAEGSLNFNQDEVLFKSEDEGTVDQLYTSVFR
jgi:SNF2 family DNA or RNA helicase